MKKRKNSRAGIIKARNYIAVHAHFRSGAGAMSDLKKEENKNTCREKVLELDEDLEYYDEIDLKDQ